MGDLSILPHFFYLFNHVYQYGFMDIYFMLWVLIHYYIIYFVAQIVPTSEEDIFLNIKTVYQRTKSTSVIREKLFSLNWSQLYHSLANKILIAYNVKISVCFLMC